MSTQGVLDELTRICRPWDAAPLLTALTVDPSSGSFGIDATWQPHLMGRPRSDTPGFDGDCFLHGAQALAFLSSRLPNGDPVRAKLPKLYAVMKQRLENPRLLLFGGFPDLKGADRDQTEASGAYQAVAGYVYFCPAKVTTPAQRDFLRSAQALAYPADTYPWSGLFAAWEAFTSPGFAQLMERTASSPLMKGQWEVDPRQSAPKVLAAVRERLGLEDAAATLFLQLLTLVDCSEAQLRETNGWSPADLKKALAPLVKADLVVGQKQPRANRKFCLPGPWLPLAAPHPAIEQWKLALYGAASRDKALAAGLGRLLPLRPIHALFAHAWDLFTAEAPAGPPTLSSRDWLAEIRAKPDDDTPRLIYADWLSEQGDARGELIAVQCQLAREKTDALVAEEKALLKKHEARWLADVSHSITGHRWTRGFITHVRAHAPTFVKKADAVFAALPLLEGFSFDAGGPGPVTPAQVRELASCPSFARFIELDTTADHYFSRVEQLQSLLDSKFMPKLKKLRLGFHRAGDGLGSKLARALAECEALKGLEQLELAGQNLGRTAMMNAPLGLEALELLLEGLPALRKLRVPYNGFWDADARALATRLEKGLGPAIVEIDFANTVETTFVTKAVDFFRNRVTPEGSHAVAAALAARSGVKLAALSPRAPAAPLAQLVQSGKFPFAALARSGTSKCVVCSQKIAIDTLRIGIERTLPEVGRITAWVHPDCRTKCPELADLVGLDARLTTNSRGQWPAGQ